jgi:hypothetical protein
MRRNAGLGLLAGRLCVNNGVLENQKAVRGLGV